MRTIRKIQKIVDILQYYGINIPKMLLWVANKIDGTAMGEAYQRIDNINFYSKDFITMLENDGYIKGFVDYKNAEEMADMMLEINGGGFAVIEGNNVTITKNPTDYI